MGKILFYLKLLIHSISNILAYIFSLFLAKVAHLLNGVELNISLDELEKLKLSLEDITLGYENKSKIKPQLGPSFSFNSSSPRQQLTKKIVSMVDESTKDRQDLLFSPSILSASNVMVRLN